MGNGVLLLFCFLVWSFGGKQLRGVMYEAKFCGVVYTLVLAGKWCSQNFVGSIYLTPVIYLR